MSDSAPTITAARMRATAEANRHVVKEKREEENRQARVFTIEGIQEAANKGLFIFEVESTPPKAHMLSEYLTPLGFQCKLSSMWVSNDYLTINW